MEQTTNGSMNENKERINEKSDDVKSSMSDIVEIARQAAHEKYEELMSSGSDKVDDYRSRLEGRVIERPMRTLLIASGASFVLGYLLSRK